MSQSAYEAPKLLADFRSSIGDSEFGLVVQAMFAHVLLRLGGKVWDVKNPGHPDVSATLGGELYNFEVEAPKGNKSPRRLDRRDLEVLQVSRDGEHGYFCVLDSGPPVAWVCVDVASLGQRASGDLRRSLLRSYSNRDLSSDCTVEFSDLILKEAKRLDRLTYSQLRQEALSGKPR